MKTLIAFWASMTRMATLAWSWGSPISAIPKQFASFLVWVGTAIGIGGLSVWFVPLLRPHLSANDAYRAAIVEGALGTFCIALLGEALSTNLILAYRRRWEAVEGGRAVAAVLSILLLVPLALVIGNLSQPTLAERYISIQVGLAIAAVLLALYLHCFHLAEEETVQSALVQKEYEHIRQMVTGARDTATTSAGERL